MPRFQNILGEFTPSELCYLLYAYHEVGYVPKPFAAEVEALVKRRLLETEEITPQELSLIVRVFCNTRSASRDFHRLLETCILMRLNDLKNDRNIMYQIGYNFESTGLCSLDTLKAFKKVYFQSEVEQEVFN